MTSAWGLASSQLGCHSVCGTQTFKHFYSPEKMEAAWPFLPSLWKHMVLHLLSSWLQEDTKFTRIQGGKSFSWWEDPLTCSYKDHLRNLVLWASTRIKEVTGEEGWIIVPSNGDKLRICWESRIYSLWICCHHQWLSLSLWGNFLPLF